MKKDKTSIAPNKTSGNSMAAGKDDSRLNDFFIGEIRDIYWAEKHLVKTLPKMKKAATSPQLQKAFGTHLETTKEHVSRLEKVFEIMGHKPQAKKCDAIAGITKEGKNIIEETVAGTATRDVGLILAGQKVEHYEISTYGGLAQLARTLGQYGAAEILESTLNEEKEADLLLTSIAEDGINYRATEETKKSSKK
jgi:ferritin-like metal-binding protein YciE